MYGGSQPPKYTSIVHFVVYVSKGYATQFRAAGGMADPCWLGCRVAGYVLPPLETWLGCVRNGAWHWRLERPKMKRKFLFSAAGSEWFSESWIISHSHLILACLPSASTDMRQLPELLLRVFHCSPTPRCTRLGGAFSLGGSHLVKGSCHPGDFNLELLLDVYGEFCVLCLICLFEGSI